MSSLKVLRYVLWAVVLLVVATVAGVFVGRMIADEPVRLAQGNVGAAVARARYADAGGPFAMTDMNGIAVTEADFRGKPMAMFFGFRSCPDVCPTTMLDAHEWLESLGPDADKLKIVFVTVDPERDTPALLKDYLGAFDDRIVGLTPVSDAELASVAKEYAVQYQKVDLGNGDYTMNHTADTLLFDAAGKFAGYIPYTQPAARQDPTTAERAKAAALATLKQLVS